MYTSSRGGESVTSVTAAGQPQRVRASGEHDEAAHDHEREPQLRRLRERRDVPHRAQLVDADAPEERERPAGSSRAWARTIEHHRHEERKKRLPVAPPSHHKAIRTG